MSATTLRCNTSRSVFHCVIKPNTVTTVTTIKDRRAQKLLSPHFFLVTFQAKKATRLVSARSHQSSEWLLSHNIFCFTHSSTHSFPIFFPNFLKSPHSFRLNVSLSLSRFLSLFLSLPCSLPVSFSGIGSLVSLHSRWPRRWRRWGSCQR